MPNSTNLTNAGFVRVADESDFPSFMHLLRQAGQMHEKQGDEAILESLKKFSAELADKDLPIARAARRGVLVSDGDPESEGAWLSPQGLRDFSALVLTHRDKPGFYGNPVAMGREHARSLQENARMSGNAYTPEYLEESAANFEAFIRHEMIPDARKFAGKIEAIAYSHRLRPSSDAVPNWQKSSAENWTEADHLAAFRVFRKEQSEGQFAGVKFQEFADHKHKLWKTANPAEATKREAADEQMNRRDFSIAP